ncbi:ABC transporter permease subunit [Rubrobacter tropicus]|uniref:ABC transporter permease subunit n=1 Tax=Rubrobacter tropicus TaxID=2653851 RepID=A0A6G8Q818_9ACTN|nr:carbohydrate ABC transporter permease [Rubrobacter tropicus]QIN82593.1 ABC transporter permease subunit [Rubrobacter tropicus]
MSGASTRRKSPIRWGHYAQNVALWAAVVVIFGPIFWLIVTSFKTDAAAYDLPPKLLFTPTLEQYAGALESFWTPFLNSVIIVGVSTAICLLLGVPAAFALSFYAHKRNEGIVFWFITTKALPQVAVLVPLFVIFRELQLLDTVWVLIIVFVGMNTPIVVWMMYQFMKDLPRGILEAAQVDGVSLSQMLMQIVIPLTRAGIASTAMLCVIFAWNEFLFSVSFTAIEWQPLSVAVAAQQTSRGQFWAQLSAFTTLAIIVPVIVGWLTQKQLVRGLTSGAVK